MYRLKPEAGPDTLEQVYAEGGHAEGGHVEGVVEERDLDGELIAVHPVSDKVFVPEKILLFPLNVTLLNPHPLH